MIEPVVDFKVTNLCTVQIHLLFTLPNLHSTSICTLEQLSPRSYQLNGLCFGGAFSCHDLLLLSCEDKRYVVTQTELEQCFRADSTILCPDHVLSTVENPDWLALKWHSSSHLSFKHTHIPLSVVTTCSFLFTLKVATICLRLTPILLSLHLTMVHMSSRYNLWAFITFHVHFRFPFSALVLVAVHLISLFTFLYLVRELFNMSHGLPTCWKIVLYFLPLHFTFLHHCLWITVRFLFLLLYPRPRSPPRFLLFLLSPFPFRFSLLFAVRSAGFLF